jgi:thiamine pyrophosphokinase
MKDKVFHKTDPVTLVGGADATPHDLQKALTLAPHCVAADGGAAQALAAGAQVAAVIGDFDSISAQAKAQIPADRHHVIAEQDSTDFEKALSRISAPVVIGVGFTGGRLDHQLAVCHGLLRLAGQPCVLLGGDEIMVLAPPALSLPTQEGDVVSLYPMLEVCGRSDGLRWPIAGLRFAPGRQIGTSNQATGPCRIEMDSPGMLLILPARLIQPVVAALSRPECARWPAL